jgi:hypothetical protein
VKLPDKEPGGRELDAAVAEKVMADWVAEQDVGKHVPLNSVIIHIAGHSYFHPIKSPHISNWSGMWELPRYSESIEAAMQVVEKMRERSVWFEIYLFITRPIVVEVLDENGTTARAEVSTVGELPLAICRAALAAIEVESGSTNGNRTHRRR